MKLRPRLALTLVVASVPLIALVQGLRRGVERRASVQGLAQTARARMESGGREQCEDSPETFQDPPAQGPRSPPSHGPPGSEPAGAEGSRPPPPRGRPPNWRPRLEMFAYGPDLVSANPRAPSFPAEFRQAMGSGEREVGTVVDTGERREVSAAVRMNWDGGPCAIVLAWRHDDRPAVRPLGELAYAGSIVAGLLLAVLFAAGPLERRVRRLAGSVRRAAADHYREPVLVEGNDEVAELAHAFNAAGSVVRARIEELRRRERTLRDFVENTTHDVMLPMTVLQGNLNALRVSADAGETTNRQTIREALEELDYLSSLLQNLGASAKLEAGAPEVRRDPFSWNQIVDRVVLRHATIARERSVELDFAVPEDDVRARGDVTLVEQALSNVVHNAVRYNRAGGHVAVVLEREEGRFSVRVLDDGPGVAPAELERLHERSFRSDDARARHPGGTGLGLSIAKDVADRHGFELAIRKPDEGGLEVVLRGPVVHATPTEDR